LAATFQAELYANVQYREIKNINLTRLGNFWSKSTDVCLHVSLCSDVHVRLPLTYFVLLMFFASFSVYCCTANNFSTPMAVKNEHYFMVNCGRLCLQCCLQWINGL